MSGGVNVTGTHYTCKMSGVVVRACVGRKFQAVSHTTGTFYMLGTGRWHHVSHATATNMCWGSQIPFA